MNDPIFALTEEWLCCVTLGRSARVSVSVCEMRMDVDDKVAGYRNATRHRCSVCIQRHHSCLGRYLAQAG